LKFRLCAKKNTFRRCERVVDFDSRERISPSIDAQPISNRLLDDDLTGHARTLVRFAVVAVGTGDVELVGHLLARTVEVVFVGDGVGVDASRDVVFIEDDVVRERLVVDEFNSLALGDGDGRRLRETSGKTSVGRSFAHKKSEPRCMMQSDRVYANSLTWTESTHTRVGVGLTVHDSRKGTNLNRARARASEGASEHVRRSRVHRCRHRA
jgi:hypothetical protein